MNGNGAVAERVETVIIGGGQAGLATGFHLRRRGRPFVILDANQRIGDAWRQRWDSLRVFTPARYAIHVGPQLVAATDRMACEALGFESELATHRHRVGRAH